MPRLDTRSDRHSAHNNWVRIFVIFLSLAFTLIAFHGSASDLLSAWQTDEYSHGSLIPFIAVLLAWHRLTEKRPYLSPSWYGLGVLAAGGFLLLISRLATFNAAGEYGFVLALVGFSLVFLSTKASRVMLPAFIYLLFAIPLPHLIYSNLSQKLQLISSTLGVGILDIFNIPVFQEGNIIDLGGYKLQVVEACSGLRYLFPLMSFGYLIAYLFKDRLWKRVVLFLSTIPITIGMNSLRIAFIGFTVDLWGPEMASGFLHIFEGWVVFFFCVLILLGEVALFLNFSANGRFRYNYLGLAKGPLFANPLEIKAPSFAALAVSCFLLLLFGTGLIDQRVDVTPFHPPFAKFPEILGSWHGHEGRIEADVLDELQLSDYWIADYRKSDDESPVNFYMAYYASQRVGSAAHSPANCIPGGGWQITGNTTEQLKLDNGYALTVSRLLIQKEDVTHLVYYWFDERGRDLTETYGAKWYLIWDSIRMHRTDGALIRLVTDIRKGESPEIAENRLKNFLAVAYPQIRLFVPGQ